MWLGQVYRFFEEYEQALAARVPGPESRYFPKSRAEWLLDRDRLKAVHHLLLESLDDSDRGTAFVDAVRKRADEPRALHRRGWMKKFAKSEANRDSARCFSRLLGF